MAPTQGCIVPAYDDTDVVAVAVAVAVAAESADNDDQYDE